MGERAWLDNSRPETFRSHPVTTMDFGASCGLFKNPRQNISVSPIYTHTDLGAVESLGLREPFPSAQFTAQLVHNVYRSGVGH